MGLLQERIEKLAYLPAFFSLSRTYRRDGRMYKPLNPDDVLEIVEEMRKEGEKKFAFLTDEINFLPTPEAELKEFWKKWIGTQK